jgi:hypothetical protein
MAGSRRLLSPSGHVGFHASYYDSNGKAVESGAANALVGNYLTLLGASAKTIVFATTAPPDKVLWLTAANKEASGIDFENIASSHQRTTLSMGAPTRMQPVPPPPAPIALPPPDSPASPNTFPKFHEGSLRYRGMLHSYMVSEKYNINDVKSYIDKLMESNPWIGFSSDSNTVSYFDSRSIKYNHINSTFILWVKVDNNKTRSFPFDEVKNMYNLSCNKKTLTVIDSVGYYSDGRIDSDQDLYRTERVIPDTMGSALWERMCGNDTSGTPEGFYIVSDPNDGFKLTTFEDFMKRDGRNPLTGEKLLHNK